MWKWGCGLEGGEGPSHQTCSRESLQDVQSHQGVLGELCSCPRWLQGCGLVASPWPGTPSLSPAGSPELSLGCPGVFTRQGVFPRHSQIPAWCLSGQVGMIQLCPREQGVLLGFVSLAPRWGGLGTSCLCSASSRSCLWNQGCSCSSLKRHLLFAAVLTSLSAWLCLFILLPKSLFLSVLIVFL